MQGERNDSEELLEDVAKFMLEDGMRDAGIMAWHRAEFIKPYVWATLTRGQAAEIWDRVIALNKQRKA